MKTLKVKVKDDSTSIKVIEPASYKKAIIIANGAGANMSSDFISYYHKELSEKYLTIKFNFLYQEKNKKVPDFTRLPPTPTRKTRKIKNRPFKRSYQADALSIWNQR